MTTVRFNLDNLAVAALSFEEPEDDEEADTGNPGAANLPLPPQGPPQGPLAATTAGILTLAEAQAVDLTYTILLGPTSTLTNQERLEQISDQPPPFALLIIRHPDSTPALIHSIKCFHTPISTNHPLHGCILGFISDAMQWNSMPQLIQIPLTALSNTTDLQIAPTQTLLDANQMASTVAANATDPAQQTSTMINIPPCSSRSSSNMPTYAPSPCGKPFTPGKPQTSHRHTTSTTILMHSSGSPPSTKITPMQTQASLPFMRTYQPMTRSSQSGQNTVHSKLCHSNHHS